MKDGLNFKPTSSAGRPAAVLRTNSELALNAAKKYAEAGNDLAAGMFTTAAAQFETACELAIAIERSEEILKLFGVEKKRT